MPGYPGIQIMLGYPAKGLCQYLAAVLASSWGIYYYIAYNVREHSDFRMDPNQEPES